jgi:hypothetical protein
VIACAAGLMNPQAADNILKPSVNLSPAGRGRERSERVRDRAPSKCYGATPSTIKSLSVPYFSPMANAAFDAAELAQASAFSRLSN